MECVTPHLQEVPESHWFCGTCVDCVTCKTKEAGNNGVKHKGEEGMRMLDNECVSVDQSTTAPESVALWGPSMNQCNACAAEQLATEQVEGRGMVYDFNVISS
jgi:hypothetical protein